MSYIVYLLYRGSQVILGLIPMSWLYLFSPLLYLVLYHIIGYRKAIAYSNMKKCFPEWSETQLKAELKIFYRYLSDLFVEGLKSGTISMEYLKRTIEIENQDIIHQLKAQGKSAIFLLGHYSNWEWGAVRYGNFIPIPGIAVYRSLKNKRINDHVKKNRERSGIKLWSIEEFKKKRHLLGKKPNLLFLIADQNPTQIDKSLWINFFGQLLPWYSGPENMARKLDVPVFFSRIEYVKRGRYRIHLEEIQYDITKNGDLTQKFVRLLEAQIKEHPPYWLWTHKRWKRAHLFDPEKHLVIHSEE